MDNEKVCKFVEKLSELSKEYGVELLDYATRQTVTSPSWGPEWYYFAIREVKP